MITLQVTSERRRKTPKIVYEDFLHLNLVFIYDKRNYIKLPVSGLEMLF